MVRSSLPVLLVAGSGHASSVTPIEKVLELMNGMLAKGEEAKHKEEVEFNTFKVWCENTWAETKNSISDGEGKIVQLNADIDKANADAQQLKEEIAELEANTAAAEDQLAAATEVRNKENADYKATHMDLSESVDAIGRALIALKAKQGSTAQASLLQIQKMPQIPAEAKAAIASFLGMANDADEGAPEAAGYEFQSGGVVDMLEKLKLKFEDQRLGVEKAEISAKSNFQVLHQQLHDDINDMKKSISEKTDKKAERLSDAADAKGDLQVTTQAKSEDETKLDETLSECAASAEEFEKNQVLRSEEIKAIREAAKILSSDEVSGAAGKHLPSLLQRPALAQLRSTKGDVTVRERVVELLQSRAKRLGSKYLAMVAEHAGDDPFSKVKKMIKDLITKLMEEANAEADHKGFCDTELATNKQTREIKASEVEDLSASIDKHNADIAQLSDEITALSDDISSISAQQAEASQMRAENKETNAAAVADAKAAQTAVEQAMHVLKEFYGKTPALVQSEVVEPYKGMQSESGNIMSFLDVILSDFARLEAETNTAEEQQAAAHQKFMDETTEDSEVKQTELSHKQSKKDRLVETTRDLSKELELTQKELDAAFAYYDKLKPDCVDQGLSYEDRVANRKEEIESLQEALKILSGEQVA